METYALYCNGNFVMAKNFMNPPKVLDFGVGAIPTSCYDIMAISIVPSARKYWHEAYPATIDVGAKGLADNY